MGKNQYICIKRAFDLCLTIPAFLILSPILFFIALCVRLSMGKPVFFIHKRPGKGGEYFSLYKFRTMNYRRDADGCLLPDSERLTRVGMLLRATSLDELPELWNVIKGDMSLVGPRPLLVRYLDRYTPEQARRHEVKPGLTGWAQVNGRNALSWEVKFKLDVWYVDNVNLWLDIKIIFMTIFQVIRREGIRAKGHATMPEFFGTEGDRV
jgi:sugar transferase EpsL